jgi:hypothetical protein
MGAAVEEVWAAITEVDLATLIATMPRRIQDVIRARGGQTGC